MIAAVLDAGAPATAAEMTILSDESKFTTPAASRLAKIVIVAVHNTDIVTMNYVRVVTRCVKMYIGLQMIFSLNTANLSLHFFTGLVMWYVFNVQSATDR